MNQTLHETAVTQYGLDTVLTYLDSIPGISIDTQQIRHVSEDPDDCHDSLATPTETGLLSTTGVIDDTTVIVYITAFINDADAHDIAIADEYPAAVVVVDENRAYIEQVYGHLD